MKLIDVLVMISKGELKEGTKVRMGNFIHTCDNYFWWNQVNFFEDLNNDVEIVDNDTLNKIEELTWEEAHSANGFNMNILNKLNEVIRELNRRFE